MTNLIDGLLANAMKKHTFLKKHAKGGDAE